MPSPYEPDNDRFELRDEITSGKYILRLYIDRAEPPGRREAWQVNERTPTREKLVLRGAGHDRKAIVDVIRRLEQAPRAQESERRSEPPRPRPRTQPRDGFGSQRDEEFCFVAGRVVDYLEQEERATFRVEYRAPSREAAKVYTQWHPGTVAYRYALAERLELGTLINVPRGEQPAIDRKIADIEVKREAGRTFIVARYIGDPTDIPSEVWFEDGKRIKRGSERCACPLTGEAYSANRRAMPPIYLVLERCPSLAHLSPVLAHYRSKPAAQEKALELEAALHPERQESPKPPGPSAEWWRRAGRALRERRDQQQMPPIDPMP